MRGLFVTGTDTGVGKTFVTAQLLRLLRARGLRCAGFKPICCGDRSDAEILLAASSAGFDLEDLNPLWLRTPAAPIVAARIENVTVDQSRLVAAFEKLKTRCDFIAVEGVGGWQVPIAPNGFMSDLAAAFALPALMVAENKLGCLNQILLTAQSIMLRNLPLTGVVLNLRAPGTDVASLTNAEVIAQFVRAPILPMLSEKTADLSEDWARALQL